MRLRLLCLPPRLKWGLLSLLLYFGLAWILGAWLPSRPSLTITPSEPAEPTAFSDDGKTLVTASRLRADSLSNSLQVWDRTTGQMRAVIRVPSGIIWQVHVAPDGSLVGAVVGTPFGNDNRVNHLYLWDGVTSSQIASFVLGGFPGYHVGFAPDGRTLAFTTEVHDQYAVTLWNVPTRSLRTVLEQTHGPLAFSPDGRTLATISRISNARVKLWDVMTGIEKGALDHPSVEWRQEMELSGIIPELAFSTDGKSLGMVGFITPSDDNKLVQKVKGSLKGHDEEDEPSHLVRVWDLATNKIRAERFLGYSFYADCPGTYWEGIYVLNLHQDDGCERLFDPSTGVQQINVSVAGEPDYALSCLCAGPFYGIKSTAKGEVVLVDQSERGSSLTSWHQWLERILPFWKSGGRNSRSSLQLYAMRSKERLATLANENFGCFSSDARTLATYSEEGKIIHVWDVPPGRPWLAIFGWAALPAGLMGLSAEWRLRRKQENKNCK